MKPSVTISPAVQITCAAYGRMTEVKLPIAAVDVKTARLPRGASPKAYRQIPSTLDSYF